jgi:hypothetical protein
MSEAPDQRKTTGDELAAVRAEVHEVSGVVAGLARLSEAERRARDDWRAEERERQWQADRNHTGLTPEPVVTHSDVKLAISERCESCQRPGGSIYELATEVKGLAKEVKDAVLSMADTRGANRVWKVVGGAAWAIALLILGVALNHLAAKRTEDTLKQQAVIAEKVAVKLKAVEDLAKGLAPDGMYSPAKGAK